MPAQDQNERGVDFSGERRGSEGVSKQEHSQQREPTFLISSSRVLLTTLRGA